MNEVLVEVEVVRPPRLLSGQYYRKVEYMIVRREDGEEFVIVRAYTPHGHTCQITLHWPIVEMMIADKEGVESV